MNYTILAFANLNTESARISVLGEDGSAQFVAELAPGAAARYVAANGQRWSVASGSTVVIAVGSQNRVYVIGMQGVYQVESVSALGETGEAKSNNFAFPGAGAGGWP